MAADVSINYAASDTEGGAALDVSCAGCIALGAETTGAYDSTPDSIADDGAISDTEAADALSISNGLLFAPAGAGAVGIGTTTPAAAALLDLSSTARGFLPPRLTTAQRDAMSAPVAGMTVFNVTTGMLNIHDGAGWRAIDMTSDTLADDGAVSGAEITDGSIAAADVGFTYAGSASPGGAASDVSCSSCVALGTETSGTFDPTPDTIVDDGAVSGAEITDGTITAADVSINFAASVSQGGAASDVACAGCVGAAEVAFNYAASAAQGGAANDLACSNCVTLGAETQGTYDATSDSIADDGVIEAAEVGFSYALGVSKGGAAADLACATPPCVGDPEIAALSFAKLTGVPSYAGSASPGGAASDVACTTCIATSELADASVTRAKLAAENLTSGGNLLPNALFTRVEAGAPVGFTASATGVLPTYSVVDVGADGVAGPAAFESGAATRVILGSAARVPLDLNSTYRARATFRKVAAAGGSNGSIVFAVRLFDAAGAEILTAGSYWLTIASSPMGTSWQRLERAFGAGTVHPLPAAARTMDVVAHLNDDAGVPGNQVYQVQGLGLFELTPARRNYNFCYAYPGLSVGVGDSHVDHYALGRTCSLTSTGGPIKVEWCLGLQQSGGGNGGTLIRLWVDGVHYATPSYWEYNNPNDNWHTNNCGRFVIPSPAPGQHTIDVRAMLHACGGGCTYIFGDAHVYLEEL